MQRRESPHGGESYVRETDDSWDVVDRASGEVLSTHDRWRDALNALLERASFARAVRDGVFHDDAGSPCGVWRWLDASAEEPAPGPDGSQVTAGAMRSMIDKLNGAAHPVMVDGGTDDSGAHESTEETSVRANGWAHVGAEWVDLSGRVHLALYTELHPSIAPDVTSGRLAFGSIAFSQSHENPDDAALWSHALTNLPAVTGLMPSSANRTPTAGRLFARALPTRSVMIEKKNKPAARGAAQEKLAQLKAMLGMESASDEDFSCAMYDTVYALKQGASLEKILEGGVAALSKKPDETDEGYGARMAALVPAKREDVPPEQEKALLADFVSIARGIFGQADADEAALVELMKAHSEAFKGAIGAAGQPVVEPKTDESAAKPEDGEKDDAARAQNVGLAASVRTLTARVTASEERAAKLEAEVERRDLSDTIKARFLTANITLADAELGQLVELAQRNKGDDRARVIDMALKAANVPPSGRAVTPPQRGESAPVAPADDGSLRDAAAAAYQAALRTIESEHPEWTSAKRSDEAYSRTRSLFAAAAKN